MTRRPAPHSPTRMQTSITCALLLLWVFLMSFGVVSIIDPPWLQALSDLGTDVESRAAKNTADAYLREHRYQEAIDLYEHALEIRPDQVGVLVNLAVAYGRSGRLGDGVRILSEALQSGTTRPGVVSYNLADLLYRQNRIDAAIQCYHQALDTSVRPDRVYGKLGETYAAAGRYDEARTAYETALRIQRDVCTSYRHMLRQALTTHEDFPESMEAIGQHLAQDVTPDDLARYDLQMITYMQRGDKDIARTYYHLGVISSRQ